MQTQKTYTLKELTAGLDVTIKGDPDCPITGVAMIQEAVTGQLTFLHNPLYKKYLASTQASAVIVNAENAPDCATHTIIAANPYLVYAQIANYFKHQSQVKPGIHPSAVIGQNNIIDPTAHIAAHCVLGDNVNIGADVVIGPGCTLGDQVTIGASTHLDAHVTLYYGVQVGERCHLYSGVVIGSDGFGFANDRGSWQVVPQLGTVILGNDVAVGANTTIDRGAIGNTIIEDGVKLDNLIQIGHNVKIGAHTIIAGCVGIAGSTTIGKYCMIGGASCINGHLTIADKVMITGMSAITKSITDPGLYSSGIVGALPNAEFRKMNAYVHRLGNLNQRVKSIETTLKMYSLEQS